MQIMVPHCDHKLTKLQDLQRWRVQAQATNRASEMIYVYHWRDRATGADKQTALTQNPDFKRLVFSWRSSDKEQLFFDAHFIQSDYCSFIIDIDRVRNDCENPGGFVDMLLTITAFETETLKNETCITFSVIFSSLLFQSREMFHTGKQVTCVNDARKALRKRTRTRTRTRIRARARARTRNLTATINDSFAVFKRKRKRSRTA